MHLSASCSSLRFITRAGSICALLLAFAIVPPAAFSQQTLPPTEVNREPTDNEVNHHSSDYEHDTARSVEHHLYANPAQRAEDDLLITEVASALREEGISADYPVIVDADHGRIVLKGVVSSPAAVDRAGRIAAAQSGVRAVKNELISRR